MATRHRELRTWRSRKAVHGPPPKRLVRPTGLLWALLVVLMILLGGLSAAIAHAQEVEPERYQPASRGGRAAVQELAEAHFAPGWVAWAVRTAGCESGYDLNARSAGFDRRFGVWYEHVGALQISVPTWGALALELFGGPLSDPDVNFAMGAWIVERYGPAHWPWCGR